MVAAAWLLVVLAVEFAAVLGIERLPLLAGLVGPRNAETTALVGLGAVLLVAGGLIARFRLALILLAAASLLGAACSVPVMLGRGWSDDPPAAAHAGSLRVLSWNINFNLVSPDTVARLAARERADIVVLPEIPALDADNRYVPAFAAAGIPVRSYPAISDYPAETFVLVRTGVGRYSSVVGHSSDPDRSAALTPVTAGLPTIVAIHAAQPSLRDNPQWRSDLTWVEQRCENPDTIAVGDFNATLDSFGGDHLGGCTDGADRRDAASVGTWPTRLPAWAGMPLDHVLTGTGWTTRSFTVIRSEDGSGARHRPILAVVAPAR